MKHLEILQRQSQDTHLMDEERQVIRESLMTYINKHPASNNPIKKKSWIDNCYPANWSTSIWLLVTVFVFSLAGAAVVSAAQESIPGDFLYVVKTSIKEPIQQTLAFGDKRKAETEISFAEHRLIEAENLQKASRLTDSLKVTLGKNFQMHVQRASDNIKKMANNSHIDDALAANYLLVSTVGSHAPMVTILTSASK
jgi:hypothetical protein